MSEHSDKDNDSEKDKMLLFYREDPTCAKIPACAKSPADLVTLPAGTLTTQLAVWFFGRWLTASTNREISREKTPPGHVSRALTAWLISVVG